MGDFFIVIHTYDRYVNFEIYTYRWYINSKNTDYILHNIKRVWGNPPQVNGAKCRFHGDIKSLHFNFLCLRAKIPFPFSSPPHPLSFHARGNAVPPRAPPCKGAPQAPLTLVWPAQLSKVFLKVFFLNLKFFSQKVLTFDFTELTCWQGGKRLRGRLSLQNLQRSLPRNRFPLLPT